jgi:serine/threonine protein kinase
MSDYMGAIDDAWGQELDQLIEEEPVPVSAVLAVESMRGMKFTVRGVEKLFDPDAALRIIEQKRDGMRIMLLSHECHAEVGEECALAIHLYTLERPFRLYSIINSQMHSPDRTDAQAEGGISIGLRACLPYIKLLYVALQRLPARFRFTGRCFRGVKWAFPTPETHNPEGYFPPGRILQWYEFKSASTTFNTMYQECFCGRKGPRTIFHIVGVQGFLIQDFSACPNEHEVLFAPGTSFRVVDAVKKLLPEHLLEGASPGGFPDDVRLECPPANVPESIPQDLILNPDKCSVNFADSATLGRGGCADVWRGEYMFESHKRRTDVAVKLFRDSEHIDASTRKKIMQEARLGQRLEHPNLIRLFGIVEFSGRGLALVLELAHGGSLQHVLSDRNTFPKIDWSVRIRWMFEVLQGLQKMHGLLPRAVIHRDLKAANVLLTTRDPRSAIAKLSDFGIAHIKETMTNTSSMAGGGGVVGTLAWQAPETFGARYGPASDIYGFGVTLFEIITRQQPWMGVAAPEVLAKVTKRFEVIEQLVEFGVGEDQQRVQWLSKNPLADRRPNVAAVEDGCPAAVLDLMQRCWGDFAKERPSVPQCMKDLHRIASELGLDISQPEQPVTAEVNTPSDAPGLQIESEPSNAFDWQSDPSHLPMEPEPEIELMEPEPELDAVDVDCPLAAMVALSTEAQHAAQVAAGAQPQSEPEATVDGARVAFPAVMYKGSASSTASSEAAALLMREVQTHLGSTCEENEISSRTNLMFYIADFEWAAEESRVQDLVSRVRSQQEDLSGEYNKVIVVIMFEDLYSGIVDLADPDQDVSQSYLTDLKDCLSLLRGSRGDVKTLKTGFEMQADAEMIFKRLCLELQTEFAMPAKQMWERAVFGDSPRLALSDLKTWILSAQPGLTIDENTWAVFQQTVQSYRKPGFVSLPGLVRFANQHDPGNGDLIPAMLNFIRLQAQGSLKRLADTSVEFRRVERMVRTSMSKVHHPFTLELRKLEEVKNVKLLATYNEAKQDIGERQKRRFHPVTDSTLLFHGTTPRALANIVVNGFRIPEKTFGRWLSQTVGLEAKPMFGSGVYFTDVSTKAALYANLNKTTSGDIKLLLCDVVLGDSDEKMTASYATNFEACTRAGFDSVHGRASTRQNGINHDEFIVYQPEQAMPRYVATCHLEALDEDQIEEIEETTHAEMTMGAEFGFIETEKRKAKHSGCTVM